MTFAQFIRDDVQSSHKLSTYYIFISFKITLLMIKLQVLRMIQMICSGKKIQTRMKKKSFGIFHLEKNLICWILWSNYPIRSGFELFEWAKKIKEIVVWQCFLKWAGLNVRVKMVMVFSKNKKWLEPKIVKLGS